jgi:hypothetical protein
VRPLEVHGRNLSGRVHAGICASGKHHTRTMPAQPPNGFLELGLYGPATGLPLAAEERGAVIRQGQFVTCHASGGGQRADRANCTARTYYSSTNSRMTISAESPSRGPSFTTRV